jgi:transcriptional antiterminator RfaH
MTRLSSTSWYVVQTQPNAERKAVLNLNRQGYQVYLPQYLRRRRHARRVEMVKSPLFPRYLFVAIDMAAQRWRSIQSTIGVSRLVCNGDMPAAVPAGVVDQLRAREDGQGMIRLDRRPNFAPGDRVRVQDGVFDSCLGLFEGLTDGERVAILLDLLGRKVRVFIDADFVTAA